MSILQDLHDIANGKKRKPDPYETIGAVFSGAVIGATIGVLIAPKSGKETREQIKLMAKEEIEKSKAVASDTKDDVKDKAAEISDKTKEAAVDTKDGIKEKVNEAKETAQIAKDEGKKAVEETKERSKESRERS